MTLAAFPEKSPRGVRTWSDEDQREQRHDVPLSPPLSGELNYPNPKSHRTSASEDAKRVDCRGSNENYGNEPPSQAGKRALRLVLRVAHWDFPFISS